MAGATRQRVFTGRSIDDLGIQLTTVRSLSIARAVSSAVARVSARCIVPDVEPVGCRVHWLSYSLVDDLACGASVDASDEQIWNLVLGSTQSTFVENGSADHSHPRTC